MTSSGVGRVSAWRWAVPGAVIVTVGAAVGLAGLMGLVGVLGATAGGADGAGRVLAGAFVGLFGVAMLRGGLRSADRFHAVGVERPLHDLAQVALGDGYHDGLEALGVDPFYVATGLLPQATLAVDGSGLELWFGGRRPQLRASVPWHRVEAVMPAASHTAGSATAPAAALEAGGERLLLVPRRGTVAHGWATLDEVLALIDHLERLRTGEEPEGELFDPEVPVTDAPYDDEPRPAAPPTPTSTPTPTAATSIEERIRRLSRRDGPGAGAPQG
ncbi:MULTISPECIES: hypothetical protein [unclassified Actinotalea]|uniref:hypothetical protein n=1 Tax=unclassified Actinotalea TaxID=2638618 RepID=UPI0015F68F66|nr:MULTISPECIES: hypothetical protein [unclassified Actinotalea]